ncbi:hypothetical protein TB2_023939 [Malus domestica]
MGPLQSTRLNVIIGEAPLLRCSTMATTAVATTVTITRDEVHSTTTTARAVPSKYAQAQAQAVPSKAYDTKATAQALHSHASRTEQPTHVAELALEQPTLVAQPALMAQPVSVAFQATQIGPRLVQLSQLQIFGPMIKPGAFSPHFSIDLTVPNSNLTPGVYHTSTA